MEWDEARICFVTPVINWASCQLSFWLRSRKDSLSFRFFLSFSWSVCKADWLQLQIKVFFRSGDFFDTLELKAVGSLMYLMVSTRPAARRGTSSRSAGRPTETTLDKQTRAATAGRARGKRRTRLRLPKERESTGESPPLTSRTETASRKTTRQPPSSHQQTNVFSTVGQTAISSAKDPGSKAASHTSHKSR
jgi:hypothetical protein